MISNKDIKPMYSIVTTKLKEHGMVRIDESFRSRTIRFSISLEMYGVWGTVKLNKWSDDINEIKIEFNELSVKDYPKFKDDVEKMMKDDNSDIFYYDEDGEVVYYNVEFTIDINELDDILNKFKGDKL